MRWLGLLLGIVFTHHWLGALLGYFFGRSLDTWYQHQSLQQENARALAEMFFRASFLFMGHMAKIDGVVTEREISIAEKIIADFHFDAERRREALGYFTRGRDGQFNLNDVITALRNYGQNAPALLELFLELQWRVALADGLTEPKKALLFQLCQQCAPSEAWFLTMVQRYALRNDRTQTEERRYRFKPEGSPDEEVLEPAVLMLALLNF